MYRVTDNNGCTMGGTFKRASDAVAWAKLSSGPWWLERRDHETREWVPVRPVR